MPEFKVTFNCNVKLGKDLFRKGDSATVTEDVCESLVETGVITDDYEPIKSKSVDEMTVPELREYATESGIDLGEAKKRDDILMIIQATEDDE